MTVLKFENMIGRVTHLVVWHLLNFLKLTP